MKNTQQESGPIPPQPPSQQTPAPQRPPGSQQQASTPQQGPAPQRPPGAPPHRPPGPPPQGQVPSRPAGSPPQRPPGAPPSRGGDPRDRHSRDTAKGPPILTDRIKADKVRLLDGENTRIMPREEAEALSKEQELDLMIVSLDAEPIVVRLVDYGRYRYEQEKKQKEAKKKQHNVEVKEVKMGVRIDNHDYQVKVNRASKFLLEGNRVKLTIRLRGREIQHQNLAYDLARKFVEDLKESGNLEGQIRMEGRTLVITLAPLKH